MRQYWMPFLYLGASMSEKLIQNQGRNALAGLCLNFRVNVGMAWTGIVKKLPGNRVLITNARPFDTGLPAGFSDTFGLTPVVITPEMVGQTIGVFHAIEFKHQGVLSTAQKNFLQAIRDNGGRAGVARSAESAVAIALGK